MKRSEMLKKNHLFTAAYRKGKSRAAANVVVYALRNYHRAAATKIGIAASAKLGGAVKRNRVKRIIRAAAGSMYPRLDCGYFIIIAARKPCFDKQRKSTEIERELSGLFAGLNLFKA